MIGGFFIIEKRYLQFLLKMHDFLLTLFDEGSILRLNQKKKSAKTGGTTKMKRILCKLYVYCFPETKYKLISSKINKSEDVIWTFWTFGEEMTSFNEMLEMEMIYRYRG